MVIFLNIVMFCALSVWGGAVIMSPMMFASENFGEQASSLYFFFVLMLFPVPLLIFMHSLSYKFLFMNSMKVAIFFLVIGVFIIYVSGSLTKLSNIYKGINNYGYTITETHIYSNGSVLEGADVSSFKELDVSHLESLYLSSAYQGYATDKYQVYRYGKVFHGLQPEQIKLVNVNGELFLMNNSQVADQSELLEGAVPANFSVNEQYSHWRFSDNEDQYLVYYTSHKLPEVDKASFEILSSEFAKDKRHIFDAENIVLSEADIETFQLHTQDPRFAFDKNSVYFINTQNKHKVDGLDSVSLTVFSDDSYIKDKDHIYYIKQYTGLHKLDVDYQSFNTHNYDPDTESDAQDKNHYYYDGQVVGDKQ